MANRTWEGATSGDYSVAGNWVEGAVPINGDSVRIPATSTQAITSGLNQSAVTLVDFIVEEGAPAMGIEGSYLQIALSGKFRFAGGGTSYIDLGSSAITAQVDNTATPNTGYRGLYLKDSAMSTLIVNGGSVGFAWLMGETSTATNIRVAAGSLWLGEGVTNTGLQQSGGSNICFCSTTTLTMDGGTLTTRGAGTIGTANVNGGVFYPNSSGTITTMNLNGGYTDFTTCGVARTVSTLTQERGSVLAYSPAILTITTRSAPSRPVSIACSAPGSGSSTFP